MKKKKSFKLGKIYKIRPYTLDAYDAEYVGQVTANGYSDRPNAAFDVFGFDFYTSGDPKCIMALDSDGYSLAHGHTVEEMMDDWKRVFRYYGNQHLSVSFGDFSLTRADFLKQATEAGIKQPSIDEMLLRGRFQTVQGSNGDIKWCPTCKAIRQTSCFACGCGNCRTCGKRWSCYIPPMIIEPLLYGLPSVFPYKFSGS